MPEAPVAIITGAGSGIGRATAVLLTSHGHRLTLVGRTESKLRNVAAELEPDPAGSNGALVIAEDLQDAHAAQRIFQRCLSTFGRVDAIINNAGIAPLEPIERTTAALLEQTFAVNTHAAALLIGAAWQHFAQRGSGCIVNVSSMASVDPFDGYLVYAATKAAMDSLTRSAHNEGRSFGIRAFTVNPGAVETPLLRSLFSEQDISRDRTLDPGAVAQVIVDCVLGRRNTDAGSQILLPSP